MLRAWGHRLLDLCRNVSVPSFSLKQKPSWNNSLRSPAKAHPRPYSCQQLKLLRAAMCMADIREVRWELKELEAVSPWIWHLTSLGWECNWRQRNRGIVKNTTTFRWGRGKCKCRGASASINERQPEREREYRCFGHDFPLDFEECKTQNANKSKGNTSYIFFLCILFEFFWLWRQLISKCGVSGVDARSETRVAIRVNTSGLIDRSANRLKATLEIGLLNGSWIRWHCSKGHYYTKQPERDASRWESSTGPKTNTSRIGWEVASKNVHKWPERVLPTLFPTA